MLLSVFKGGYSDVMLLSEIYSEADPGGHSFVTWRSLSISMYVAVCIRAYWSCRGFGGTGVVDLTVRD